MSPDAPSTSELDALRERADRFIADLDEEYYLHFSGQKESLDVEQVYERYEDLTRLETAKQMEGAPAELWRFASEGYLGNLTREHQARLAREEAALEAKVGGETIPYRMLRVAMSNEPDRDKRRELEETRAPAARRAPESRLPRRRPDRPRGRAAARRAELLRALQAVRLPPRLSSPTSAARCSTRPRSSGRREGDRLFRSRLGIGLSDARAWDVPRLFRAPELDQLYPSGPHAAGARVDARRPRHRPALAGERPPRSREPPLEVAARVLRADRGSREGDAGDPADRRQGRLGGAVPRGRPHGALRAHERRPADGGPPARRHGGHRGLGGAARAPGHRSGLAEPAARRAAPAGSRPRRRRLAPLLRPALLGQAALRDRVLPGGRPAVDAAALLRDPERRAQAPGQPRRATSTTSTAAST